MQKKLSYFNCIVFYSKACSLERALACVKDVRNPPPPYCEIHDL